MEQNETIRKFLPPRVIDSITSGVNRIEKRPYLLIFPILYDLLLWLGPNLSIKEPIMQWYSQFLREAGSLYEIAKVEPQPLFDFKDILSEYLSGYNLLSAAKTFPIGIPSLLTNVDTSLTPLGPSEIINIANISSIIGVIVLLSLIGVLFGTLFFHLASRESLDNQKNNILQQLMNSMIYSLLLFIIASSGVVVSIFISTFFAILSPVLGQFILLLFTMALVIFLLPAFYAFVPIFQYNQSFYQAIITSYKVVGLQMRYKINKEHSIIISPRIITFSMAIFILYQGLNIVWLQLPPIDSWWMLTGILGHAFTSTLVLVSCFDFFHKMCEWHRKLTQIEVC